jgi:hypothetical protein
VRQNLSHSKINLFPKLSFSVMIVSPLFLEMVVEPLFLSLKVIVSDIPVKPWNWDDLFYRAQNSRLLFVDPYKTTSPSIPGPSLQKLLRGKNRTTRERLWSNLRAPSTFEQDKGMGRSFRSCKNKQVAVLRAHLVWEDRFPYLIFETKRGMLLQWYTVVTACFTKGPRDTPYSKAS